MGLHQIHVRHPCTLSTGHTVDWYPLLQAPCTNLQLCGLTQGLGAGVVSEAIHLWPSVYPHFPLFTPPPDVTFPFSEPVFYCEVLQWFLPLSLISQDSHLQRGILHCLKTPLPNLQKVQYLNLIQNLLSLRIWKRVSTLICSLRENDPQQKCQDCAPHGLPSGRLGLSLQAGPSVTGSALSEDSGDILDDIPSEGKQPSTNELYTWKVSHMTHGCAQFMTKRSICSSAGKSHTLWLCTGSWHSAL